MIFITLGTQKFQFNRLLIMIDELIEEEVITDTVVAQIGYSSYIPKNYQSFEFKSESEINILMETANILITHSGIGSITTALKLQKKVIVVPRLKKYKEHVDDHQLEITNAYQEKGFIAVAQNKNELVNTLKEINLNKMKQFIPEKSTIISSIQDFIASI